MRARFEELEFNAWPLPVEEGNSRGQHRGANRWNSDCQLAGSQLSQTFQVLFQGSFTCEYFLGVGEYSLSRIRRNYPPFPAPLIPMAKALGARVFTTVSTEEKAGLSRVAGADVVINYRTGDFAAEVRKQSAGLHAVYDSVGKTTFEQSLSVLRARGMMVLFGGSSGPVPPFDLMRLAALGSLFVTRPSLKDYTATRGELEVRAGEVLQGVAKGMLKLRLEHTYPLAEAAQAHRDLEARRTTGKILLVP
jgi:Zinc-binding dehydrogenase